MKEKILLVKLPYIDSHYSSHTDLPAGLAIISEVLDFHGIDHEFYDMQLNNSFEDFYSKVEAYNPTRIGFSMMTFKYFHNYDFINLVKEKFPDKQIIVGGPHASTFKDEILKSCKGVDVVAVMEGEETIVDLCSRMPLPEIKGIIFRENGSIVINEPRVFIENLDKYPFPKLSKFNLKNYDILPIVSSRGCPYSCIFCPVSETTGKKWRPRKAEKIVEELEYWAQKGFINFSILDDNFTLDRKRVVDICDGIKNKGLEKRIEISLGNGIRADKVDAELLKKMKESGFYQVAFGVESGNDRVLKILNKGENLEHLENAINLACSFDFEVLLFFVLGAPGEQEKDVIDSIKIAKKFPVTNIAFYHLIPFPGTKLYDWVDKNSRFRFKAPDFLNNASHWVNEPLFSTDELGILKRKELYQLANDEGYKHTKNRFERSINKRLAKKIFKKFKIPTRLAFYVVSIARKSLKKNSLVNKIIRKRIKKSLK